MESREPSSNSYSHLELHSEFNCDDCFLAESSSDLENTFAELYSEELDIASSRVQEHWQVSAARLVPLGLF